MVRGSTGSGPGNGASVPNPDRSVSQSFGISARTLGEKTLLATALGAAIATGAQAGSTVTLYGLIDMGLAYEQQKTRHSIVDEVGGNIVYGAVSGKRTKVR